MHKKIQFPKIRLTLTPKVKLVKIFGCPEGCRRKFSSCRALNIHLNKVHSSKYKIEIDERCRAYTKQTLRVKVA